MRYSSLAVTTILLISLCACGGPKNNSNSSDDPGVVTPPTAPLPLPATGPVGIFNEIGVSTINRTGHTSLLLSDGRVLIGGGDNPSFRTTLLASYFQVFDPVSNAITNLTGTTSAIMMNPIFMEIAKNQVIVFPSSYTNSNGVGTDNVFNNVLLINTQTTGNAVGGIPPMSYYKFNVNAYSPYDTSQGMNFGWLLGRYSAMLDYKNQDCVLRKVRPDTIKVIGKSGNCFDIRMPMQGIAMHGEFPASLPNGRVQNPFDAAMEFGNWGLQSYNTNAEGLNAVINGVHLEPDYTATGFMHIDCVDEIDKNNSHYAAYFQQYTSANASEFPNQDYYVNGAKLFTYKLNNTTNQMDQSYIDLPLDMTNCSFGWIDQTNVVLFKNTDILHVNLLTKAINIDNGKLPFIVASGMKFAHCPTFGGAFLVFNNNTTASKQALYFLDGTIRDTAVILSPVSGHTVTVLRDGRMIVIGGAVDPNADGTSFIMKYQPDNDYAAHIELPKYSTHNAIGVPSWIATSVYKDSVGIFEWNPTMDDTTSTDDPTLGGYVSQVFFNSEELYLNHNDGNIPLQFFFQGKEIRDNHTSAGNNNEITLTISYNTNSFSAQMIAGQWNLTVNNNKVDNVAWHQSNDGGRITEYVTITATQSQGSGQPSATLGSCRATIKIVR
jgi:hypothetical protein